MSNINRLMDRFRFASREIFNDHFRAESPYSPDGAILERRFNELQTILFQKLVTEPASLPSVPYGEIQPAIVILLRKDFVSAPAMLNREVNSGYWDHPLKEVTRDCRLLFMSFFDWDQLDYRDNRYVRALVSEWPSHPEVIGKHALIDSRYVTFARA